MWESGGCPDFRRKNKPIGVHGSCAGAGRGQPQFRQRCERTLARLAALQYGVGGLPVMRRANAQLGSIRRAAIVVAQCSRVRARPTKIDTPVVPLVSENSR